MRRPEYTKKPSDLPVSVQRRLPSFPAAFWAEVTCYVDDNGLERERLISLMYGIADMMDAFPTAGEGTGNATRRR